MSIMLTPETEARLQKKAQHRGEDINHVADTLLAEALEWEEQDHFEAVEGIRRGLEAFEQGRCRPFHDFVTEQRAKHNLPSTHKEA